MKRLINHCWIVLVLASHSFLNIQAQTICDSSGIMLQGFNWESSKEEGEWYTMVQDKAAALSDAGFAMVWLPPPSRSADPHGYLPRELYEANARYGSLRQQKECVSALRAQGIKAIADIVINHRVGSWGWADFTNPDWDCSAVTSDDEWGEQASGDPCGEQDSGDSYGAGRDIDHSNSTVQQDYTRWLRWLQEELGYAGWRYDYVRGYKGQYVQQYNAATNPYFSVGELWLPLNLEEVEAHRRTIVDWLDATANSSTAFDFTTKGVLQAALANGEYWRLEKGGLPTGLIGARPAQAVTFVDNHDTGSTQKHWPFPARFVMSGYAYILTHPGFPCVFWDHYVNWKLNERIDEMMAIRKIYQLHANSSVEIIQADEAAYVATIDDQVLLRLGYQKTIPPDEHWMSCTSGRGYEIWVNAL